MALSSVLSPDEMFALFREEVPQCGAPVHRVAYDQRRGTLRRMREAAA